MKTIKEELLEKLYTKIDSVKQAVTAQYEKIKPIAFKTDSEIVRMRKGEREHAMMLKWQALARYKELQAIESSPFFFKCVQVPAIMLFALSSLVKVKYLSASSVG